MSEDFLHGIRALLLEQGLGKVRKVILSKQLEKHGGDTVSTLSETTTHILVGNKTRLARVPVLLKISSIPETVSVVRADWISACLTKGHVLSEEPYKLHPESQSPAKPAPVMVRAAPIPSPSPEKASRPTADPGPSMTSPKPGMFAVTNRQWKPSPKKTTEKSAAGWVSSDSDYVESEGEDETDKPNTSKSGSQVDATATATAISPPPKKKAKWICEIPSSSADQRINHNQHITDRLNELLTVYQNSGEKWRVFSTTKAINAIKRHPTEITTLEEASSIPCVGKRLADKIYEIVCTGRLRRLDNVDADKEAIIKMFTNIHGVGLVTAQCFYAQGYQTLEDLKNANVLNRVQLIGLAHFDEFVERMQREEVAEIESKVKEVARGIDTGLEVVTCGSYRRGKPTCGDIDILITHPDGRSHRGVMATYLEHGHACGFLTDDLSVSLDSKTSPGAKYLGVCKLEGEGRKHRRIDIMVVPYSEFPLALVHFTGSGHMNRSMRSKADKMGMSLSEHALCTGVIRKNGVKIHDGTPLPVTCEQDVFRYLELDYLEPQERDWD